MPTYLVSHVSHPLNVKMWQVSTEPDLPGQPQEVACVSWQQLKQRPLMAWFVEDLTWTDTGDH